jgi:hypothetical protein
MKNILPALVALILLFTVYTARAATFGPYTYTVTDGKATITDFDTAFSGPLFITNTLGGCPVTAIGNYAFSFCTGLSFVTIPSNVTTIGEMAFYWCTFLARVTIPDSVTTIGIGAFYYCPGLTFVTIPNSVTTIGDYAFYNCTSLWRVYFAGNKPPAANDVFMFTSATIYYLPAYASTWPSTFAGRPTKLWNPAFSDIALSAGQVSCTVTGSPPIHISLEATTNLTTGPWLRLQTTALTSTSLVLHDPDSTNYPTRFYRIIGP